MLHAVLIHYLGFMNSEAVASAVLIHYLGFTNSEAVAAVCTIIFNEALLSIYEVKLVKCFTLLATLLLRMSIGGVKVDVTARPRAENSMVICKLFR